MNKKLLLAGPGIAAIIAGAIACGPKTTTPPTPTSSQATSAPASSAPAAPPATTQAPPPAPSTPSMTTAQQQAVTSAQSYLSDGQGFSYNGLLNQLTSQAGEGFAQSDAVFALNYLHPNWYAQAAISAKGYVADGEGFSREGLIQQLTSSAGEGFTYAQAVYGVNQAGL